MILDTGEDVENGSDWSDFAQAWSDPRLHCDTLYGAAISRWLEYFERGSFLLIRRIECVVNLNWFSPKSVLT